MPPSQVAAELRVHGVGGSSGARLLGLQSEDEPILVAQGGRTGFWKRPGAPHVEGYVWGGLTTDSKLQPLWLLLLPFTLVNVAGWMHEPEPVLRAWRIVATRMLTFAIALTLTATYVIWLTDIVVNDVGYTWLPAKYDWATPRRGVLIGAAALGLLAAATVLLALRTRGGEKYVETFAGVSPPTTRGKFFGTAMHESLRDWGFFNRAHDSWRLLLLHFFTGIALLGVLTVLAFASASRLAEPFELPNYLGRALLITGAMQVLILVALAAVSFTRSPTGFRYCGPAVASALGIAVANGMLAGAARVVDSRLDIRPGDEFLLADVAVVTLLVLITAVAAWALRWHVWPARLGDVADVPHNGAGPGTPANGATNSMRRKTASFRGLTRGLTRLDSVLTITAASFFALAVAASAARIEDRTRYRSELLAVAGSQLLAYGGLGLVFVMWRNRSNPKLRKTVGIVWDLLTFWPRRFHPFSVRPYSEQAVPELRGRILALRGAFDRVVLSVHSQGTILAMGAVAPLVDGITPNAVPVTIVTYGSPICGLYAMAFPAYFNADLTAEIHGGVQGWRNFRRRTDPIASDVNSVPTIWLDSPGVTLSPGGPLTVPSTVAERDREPWLAVETHSNYRSEPAMKRVIDELRQSEA